MRVETARGQAVPGFSYRGFSVPDLTLCQPLIDDLCTDEPAYRLAAKSTPLSWRVALYMIGRDLAIGESLADNLLEAARMAGAEMYNYTQSGKRWGCWHKDCVLYMRNDEKPKGVNVPKNAVTAKYFKHIAGYEDGDEGWRMVLSPETEEYSIVLPAGDAFIVPTVDGAYDPRTGTPFETVTDRDDAIRRWLAAGLTEEQAEKELSTFYRGAKKVAAVGSWSNFSGPLCVDLSHEPWACCADMGALVGIQPKRDWVSCE